MENTILPPSLNIITLLTIIPELTYHHPPQRTTHLPSSPYSPSSPNSLTTIPQLTHHHPPLVRRTRSVRSVLGFCSACFVRWRNRICFVQPAQPRRRGWPPVPMLPATVLRANIGKTKIKHTHTPTKREKKTGTKRLTRHRHIIIRACKQEYL